MINLRFKWTVASNLFYVMHIVPKINNWLEHPEEHTMEERYELAKQVIHKMRKRARTTTDVYGIENLPKEGGYVMYSNHQGKYDALGIILSHKEPCTVLWGEQSAKRLLARHVCKLIDGKVINTERMLEAARTIMDLSKEVAEGRKCLIFPEGMYTDNKNTMNEFKVGCFKCSLRSKTPIVPVTVYDSYKSMNSNTFEKVKTQVHYLKPIPYEEYGNLKAEELAELVKSRIQEKLDEISSGQVPEDAKDFEIK